MIIREATEADWSFIMGLSPTLIEGAKLSWHSDEVERAFQDNYIREALSEIKDRHITLIAEENGTCLGFIQVVESKDLISEETCSRIPLLAVSKDAQGKGVGQRLMEEAEAWAIKNGHRLVQLEVFSNNEQARRFYQKQGFKEDTIIMVKPLS